MILGIPGSLVDEAPANRLLAVAGHRDGEAETMTILDRELLVSLPRFRIEAAQRGERDLPGAVRKLRGCVDVADAVLIATPEYNGSFPGVLKDAIDWASHPRHSSVIESKPVAVIGASDDRFGADWAQADVRKVLDSAGAEVLDADLAVGGADGAFAPGGEQLARPEQAEQLTAIVDQLSARRQG